MFCDKCGVQIPDDSVFCPNCGKRLAVMPRVASRNTGYTAPAPDGAKAPYVPAKTERKVKLGDALFLLGGVGFIAAIVVTMLIMFGKPYLKPVDDFFDALNFDDKELLREIISDELNDYYGYDLYEDCAEAMDTAADISYAVVSAEKAEDSPDYDDLVEMFGSQRVKDCYVIRADSTLFSTSVNDNIQVKWYFLVGESDGKWKILFAEADDWLY